MPLPLLPILTAIAAIATSLLAAAAAHAARTRYALRALPLARAPHSWLLGHVPAVSGEDYHDVLVEWAREMTGGAGDFAIATPLGGRGLVAAAPSTVDAALGSRCRGSGAPPPLPKYEHAFRQVEALWPGGAASLFTARAHDARAWKLVRGALAPALTSAAARAAVSDAAAAAAEMAADVAASVAASPSASAPFDARAAGLRLALASVSASLLGVPVSAALSKPPPAPIATLPCALAHIQCCMNNPVALLSMSHRARTGRAAAALYRAAVAAAVSSLDPPPGSAGAALLALKLPPAQLAAEVGTLIMAGFEPIANALAFALCEAAASPEVGGALVAELAAAGLMPPPDGSPPRPPTAADLPKLPYTAAVVKEALRLHPVVPATPRAAPRGGAALAGASLPAGTFVLLLFKAAAVDAGAWGVDAADFRPERWLARADADTTTPRPPSWPYSAGPRSCPGTLLAQSVTATALAGVWARLELRASARPLREAATLTAHPADGHCTLTARVRGAGGTA